MIRQLLILCVLSTVGFLTFNYCTRTSVQGLKSSGGDQSKNIVHSTVSERLNSGWSFTTVKFKEDLQLTTVQFVDMKHGWIAGHEGIVYSTEDGGRSWKTSQLATGPNSYVSSISFLPSGIGWAAVRRDPPDAIDRNGYKSFVLRTNNAGQSWQEQRAWDATQIYRVRFVNNDEGWLVGRKLEDGGLFLSRTTDGGSNWVELKPALLNIPNNDFGTDIYASEPYRATLLTVDGRIYSTLDGGQNWDGGLAIRDEPEQTFVAKLGILQNKNLWVLGSTDSKEGMWTTILTQHHDHGLSRFRIDGVRVRDAVFLSENRILGCGSMPSSDNALFGSRTGVVLYSSDGGHTWAKIYRDADNRRLNAIAVDDRNVWIVGEHGLLLHVLTFERLDSGSS